jgi:hypothetical protein
VRYFVRIHIPVGVRWTIVNSSSADHVAREIFQQISAEITQIFVARADDPDDTFSDCNMDSEESAYYVRADVDNPACRTVSIQVPISN